MLKEDRIIKQKILGGSLGSAEVSELTFNIPLNGIRYRLLQSLSQQSKREMEKKSFILKIFHCLILIISLLCRRRAIEDALLPIF